MDKEFILYCDESEITGRYYSNFYAGVMVGSSQHDRITALLQNEKLKLNLKGETKWAKVTERYLEKYKALVRMFFSEVRQGNLKVRIMFRQNAYEPTSLTNEDRKNAYLKLYYQFIKYAYGLEYAKLGSPAKLRLYFDDLPATPEAVSRFRNFLLKLNENRKIQKAGLILQEHEITEVSSHEHVLLQCLDIVLGAMQFRLNDKHREKIPGSDQFAKRTIAKYSLYKIILEEIKMIGKQFESFNVGVSSATLNDATSRWTEPYLHWNFVSKEHVFRSELTKGKNKPQPTYIASDA